MGSVWDLSATSSHMYSKRFEALCLGVMLNIEWAGRKEDIRASVQK
jgi:hypothetical protein